MKRDQKSNLLLLSVSVTLWQTSFFNSLLGYFVFTNFSEAEFMQ